MAVSIAPDFSSPSQPASAQLKPVTSSPSSVYGPGYDSVGNLINPQAAGISGGTPSSTGGGMPQVNTTPSTTANTSAQFNPDQYATDQAAKAQSELDARNNQIKSGITSAYQPILDAFDKQLGLLPQQQADSEGQVNTLANSQKSDINTATDRNVSDLNSNITDENDQANQNLNDLGRNIGQVLKAGSFYLGGLGLGNSSAADDYLAQITNNADVTRGQVMKSRDMAVHQINQKIGDVKSMASQNLNDVDTWKNTQLSQITQQFRQQLADLNMAKANAQGQEGKDLVNLQQSALDNYYTRLKQLDDTVYGYKSAIAQWNTERSGWLQDQLTLMNQTHQYSSTTNPLQSGLVKSFTDKNTGQTGLYNSATGQYQYVNPPGSGSQTNNQNPLQSLLGNIAGMFSGNSQTQDPNQTTDPSLLNTN